MKLVGNVPDLEPMGYYPDVGILYAIKLTLPAYKRLREETKKEKNIPFWDFRGRDNESVLRVILFTTDTWWFKTQYGADCEIAGVRNKTKSE